MKRNLWRLAFMVVAVLVVFALYRLLTISPPHSTQFLETPYPLNMAHRGGAALAPENTMLAFQNALALGADVLELDVRASRDGELVVIHDETVDRTTDGSGKVAEMTLAQLQALDAGYHYSPDNGYSFPYRGRGLKIPTLREVLTAFPEARVNIEIKQTTPPIEEAVAQLIEEMEAQDRVLVVSSDDGVIKRFRRRMPDVATGASTGEIQSFYLLQRLRLSAFYRPVANALQVPDRSGEIQLITPRFVAAAHAQGMKVYVWTINTPDRMRELLQMGVDGIITDRPDLLHQVIAEILVGSSRK
jgi:glycerophosphoryl diester phosphodiesterase